MNVLVSASAEDDSSILPDERLYRRVANVRDVNLVTVDAVSGARRPSSGAFKSDDDGMSCYLYSVLSAAGLGPEALVRAPMNAVVAFEAWVPRLHSLGIVRDAWPPDIDEPAHPRNAAHALVKGLDALGNKARRRVMQDLAVKATWVIDPDANGSEHIPE